MRDFIYFLFQALTANPALKLEVPLRRGSARGKALFQPVPVIEPPKDYVGGSPISPESLAITRVKRFLQRELDQRSVEGFPADHLHPGISSVSMIDSPALGATTCAFWEGALGIGGETRLKVVKWFLNVRRLPSDNIRR